MADNPSDSSSGRPSNGGTALAVILAIVVAVSVIGSLAFFLSKKSSSSTSAESVAPSSTASAGAAGQQRQASKGNCTPATPATPEGGQPQIGPVKASGELQKTDDRPGTGPAAKAGDTLVVQYVGALAADGTVFDSSWGKSQPFEVPIGQGSVIEGWDEGLIGMQAGGRRTLVIPAAKGYGATGQPPKIPANADLVFVVDLLQVCS